jgi:hypothetical protein
VLEIGTGKRIPGRRAERPGDEVYTIEIVPSLGRQAA